MVEVGITCWWFCYISVLLKVDFCCICSITLRVRGILSLKTLSDSFEIETIFWRLKGCSNVEPDCRRIRLVTSSAAYLTDSFLITYCWVVNLELKRYKLVLYSHYLCNLALILVIDLLQANLTSLLRACLFLSLLSRSSSRRAIDFDGLADKTVFRFYIKASVAFMSNYCNFKRSCRLRKALW